MSDVKKLLEKLQETDQQPEELSVLDKHYYDDNKNIFSNIIDYLGSREYLHGVNKANKRMLDAVQQGDIGPGVIGKVATKGGKKLAQKLLEKYNTPELATALKGAERDEYLKALDEVYGPSSQRAKDMGFSDETWYHGTNKDFNEFDLNKTGNSSGATSSGKAVWVSDNPKVADEFAGYAGRKDNPLKKPDDVIKVGFDQSIEEARKLKDIEEKLYKEYGEMGTNIMPLRSRANPLNMGKKPWASAMERGQDLNTALWHKMDAIKYDKIKDSPAFTESAVMAITNPNQLRSTNAAFDPRFKDSGNILAGTAGTTIGFKELMKYLNGEDSSE